jgi:hypothetical protein
VTLARDPGGLGADVMAGYLVDAVDEVLAQLVDTRERVADVFRRPPPSRVVQDGAIGRRASSRSSAIRTGSVFTSTSVVRYAGRKCVCRTCARTSHVALSSASASTSL